MGVTRLVDMEIDTEIALASAEASAVVVDTAVGRC